MKQPTNHKRNLGSISNSHYYFIGLLVLIGFVGYWVAKYNGLMAWLLIMGLMAAMVISAGKDIQGFFFGFLIDERNRYSLSRLQTLVWTILILSAYLTAVFINLRTHAPDALAVAIPEQLWVLMGISVTSLLGSPLLVNQKREEGNESEMVKKAALDRAARAVNSPADAPSAEPLSLDGEIVVKQDPRQATWSDLFKGEAANNHNYLDISRVQMFFFTFILVVAYGFYLGQMFAGYSDGEGYENTISSLPAISSGMLALLGISHTAYLGNKTVPARRASGATPPPNQ
jgi:hypothetical protein